MWFGDQYHNTSALPPVKSQYPFYRRAGGIQVMAECVKKISLPLELEPQMAQPVVIHYTDNAIPAPRK